MHCEFKESKEVPLLFVCTRCGFKVRRQTRPVGECLIKECSAGGSAPRRRTYGLGDLIAWSLKLLRITPESRVVQWLLASDGEGCGCRTRQDRLNTLLPFSRAIWMARVRLWNRQIAVKFRRNLL